MKGFSKRLCVWAVVASAVVPVSAQEKVEGTLSADVVSAYIWRSQHNASFSVQPSLGLSYGGLSLGAWGSFALSPQPEFTGTQEEIDLTLGYAAGGFHVGVTDYFFFGNGNPYFSYASHSTSHTFEGNVGYDFGALAVNWYTNLAGADGVNNSGKRAYSSYLQLDAPFSLAGMDWTATVGAVPFATDFYVDDRSSGFHVNQLALRAQHEVQVGSFALPLFGQVIANPSSREMYFVAGITLNAF